MSTPFRKGKDGRYRIQLDETARAVLKDLARQLIPAVAVHDPMTKRLFPPPTRTPSWPTTSASTGHSSRTRWSPTTGEPSRHWRPRPTPRP